MKENEVNIVVDGFDFTVFLIKFDVRDRLIVSLNAPTEDTQKKFEKIVKKAKKAEFDEEVELCIGDFKKNVRVIGGSASGKNISGSGDELNCINAQCCIEFNASEEESNDLINKYYLGTTFPIEAYLEKYDESYRKYFMSDR